MGVNASGSRRWGGALVLAASLGMLILGQTVLQGRFSPLGFILYWAACLFLTGAAVLVALIDVRAVRRQTRRAERELIEDTLKNIQLEAQERTDRTRARKRGRS